MRDLIVGVDLLGRLGTGVPKDVLHLGELSAAIEHHAGLGVAEVVSGGLYSDGCRVPLDDLPDALWRQPPATATRPRQPPTPEIVAEEQTRQAIGSRFQIRPNGGQ